jgi:hypothetical protein
MPEPPNGKSVEEMYWDHVRAMSPAERMRNCFRMSQSFYTQIAARYRKEHPDIGDRELRIVMAKRLYGGDPRTVTLIKMAEADQKERTT